MISIKSSDLLTSTLLFLAAVTSHVSKAADEWILYGSDKAGKQAIYARHLASQQEIKLTAGNVEAYVPVVSPDGKQLVFEYRFENDNPDIFTLNFEGGTAKRLTHHEKWESYPSWSKNMDTIVWTSVREDFAGIYQMHVDGSHKKRLTASSRDSSHPVHSPDGNTLLFHSQPQGKEGHYDVFTMDLKGKGITQLTAVKGDQSYAKWSDKGDRIVYQSKQDENHEIYTMHADGSHQQRLTHYKGSDMHPAWSRDGSKVIYVSSREKAKTLDVYVMDVDGSNIKRITHDETLAWHPTFVKHPTTIALLNQRLKQDKVQQADE